MEELKENNAPRDRAILVGLSSPRLDRKENADEESLEELGALVETAGGVSVGVVLQTLPSPNPHTFIGEGKVDEIRELVKSQEATMVIFDNDLSPSQMRVLSEEFGVQVLDRSGLILDIFAQRAKTKEGRLQVELAQYQYLLPRLIGMWTHLERQAGTSGKGPIGSKGPGETQLETAAISTARSTSSNPILRRCAACAPRSATAAARMKFLSSPSSATRTRASRRF